MPRWRISSPSNATHATTSPAVAAANICSRLRRRLVCAAVTTSPIVPITGIPLARLSRVEVGKVPAIWLRPKATASPPPSPTISTPVSNSIRLGAVGALGAVGGSITLNFTASVWLAAWLRSCTCSRSASSLS